ncbi:Transcription factor TFIIH subunit p52/Tfb2 [Carpediemonas membranifera]|uniref:General transcription factor IIH subunit 4 n=1 Tax=Carpediemonas membranifera TaxID=201153 RepID=A0A8J6DZZ2_9EUKA|nr:Transcription factor TFIIH subunit p52/Tfb2 [Carpediemonas membranifera]|eukprot:KAG9391091.1 Transcription factor TFIIH subunit p52/Tfb2 [Carpediemonas membranifera]
MPPLAQTIVTRLSVMPYATPRSEIESWSKAEYKQLIGEHLDLLCRLKVLKLSDFNYEINPEFKETFINAIVAVTSGSTISKDALFTILPGQALSAEAEAHATASWKRVMELVLQANNTVTQRSPTLDALLKCGLLKRANGLLGPTSDSRRFLLSSTRSQVWLFCLGYVQSFSTDAGSSLVLRFMTLLFQLAPLVPGTPYIVSDASDPIRSLIAILHQAGIVYSPTLTGKKTPDGADKSFAGELIVVPTTLSAMLSSITATYDTVKAGFIVVESNFKVYAYTDDPLHIGIIQLFAELAYELDGLVVSQITPHSIRDAFHHGLSASDIIRYLEAHVHPAIFARLLEDAKEQGKAVASESAEQGDRLKWIPDTVKDQICLWEQERHRVKVLSPSVRAIRGFVSTEEFGRLRKWAESQGYLVFATGEDRVQDAVLVVTEASFGDVSGMIRKVRGR